MDPIYEAYKNITEKRKYKNQVKDSDLIKFGMSEFQYSRKDATEWVKTMDPEEREQHEEEYLGRLSGMDKY